MKLNETNIYIYIIHRYQPTTCKNPVCNNEALCPHYMICAPVSDTILTNCDQVIDIIFLIEYAVRFLTCWTVSAT